MSQHKPARAAVVLALIGWFCLAVIAGRTGAINEPGRPPLGLLGFVAVPIVGFAAAYALSSSLRRWTDSFSVTWMVGAHLWRFVGLGFILAWLLGRLPAGFAIPEGLGDIIAAAGALALLPGLRRGTAAHRSLLVWNVFGLVDLVSAIGMGVLYSNSNLGALREGGVSTELMVTFPVSLIPTFLVPLFILLHLLIFKRIAALRHADGPARPASRSGSGALEHATRVGSR